MKGLTLTQKEQARFQVPTVSWKVRYPEAAEVLGVSERHGIWRSIGRRVPPHWLITPPGCKSKSYAPNRAPGRAGRDRLGALYGPASWQAPAWLAPVASTPTASGPSPAHEPVKGPFMPG